MPAQIPANGGQPQKPTKSASLYTGRFFQGLNTNRSPLRMGGMTWIYEKFYGGQNDALIGGLNTEISNRLTLCRRPGNPVYTNPTSGVVSATFDDVDRFESFHLLGPTTEDIDVMIDTVGTSGGDQPSIWTGLDATGVRGTFPGGSKKQLVFQKSVAQQAYMESVGNTLFFGDGAEQRKWLETVITWASIPSGVLSAGQYPYYTTYLVDSNFNIQQLIGTILNNSGSSNHVTIASDGVTVTLNFASAGVVTNSGLVSGTTALPQSGSPVTFIDFTTVTQLNGQLGYVTNIAGAVVTVVLTTAVAPHSVVSDPGNMIIVNGGTPTKGNSEPTWATVALAPAAVWPFPDNVLTIDGTALWINRSLVTSTQAAGIFNWGIKGPTGQLAKVSPNIGSGTWQPNTYYSLDGVLIDSNGNLQQVSTVGTGGAVTPTWQTSVGLVTSATGGTAKWTMIQTAASLTYASGTVYCPEHVDPISGQPVNGTGQYIKQNAAGVPCLFQLQPNIQPQIIQQAATPSNTNMSAGDYVDLWYYAGDGNSGLFKPVPATTGGATATAKVNSLIFNPGPDPNEQPMVNATLNQAGEITGVTTPWASATANYSMVALFSVLITPEFMLATGGQCQLLISHDDGMVIGCAQSNVTWAGPQNLNGQSVSALNSFALIGGNNVNGDVEDTGIITFPNAGVYDFEINYFQNINEQTLVVQMNGFTPPPAVGPYTVTSCANASAGSTVYAGTFPVGVASPVGQTFDVTGFVTNPGNNGYWPCTAATTTHLTLTNPNGVAETATAVATCKSIRTMAAASAPSWPSWGVGSAPGYPSVTEQGSYPGNGHGVYAPTGGTATWNNHGPAADFVFKANQSFTLADTITTDVNQNQEAPYRTGYTSTVQPTWQKALNALTTDNPNLVWINQGPQASTANPTTLTAASGWKYGVALVNSLDDTVSNMSQFSPTTGPVTNASYINIPAGYGLPPIAQIDPQADYVNIYRTTDGGAIPLLIPGVDNSGYTIPLNEYLKNGFQDTTQDTGLNTEITGAQAGENTPPALGAINLVYHLNRLWYSIGNVVYYTTGPATPDGNGLNGTAPLNFDQMPSLVKRMFPTSIGLLVFTISDVYIIAGQGTTTNPIQPGEPYLPGVGLLSYNALDNCGTIIGLLTTDGTQMMIDPGGGFIDSGQPIGNNFALRKNDVLGQNWNPSDAYVAWYVNGEDQAWYIADGQTGWYRLCATPAPETGYSWSPFAQIAGGTNDSPSIQAVQSIEVQPGIKRLLSGPFGTGQILRRASLATPSFTDGAAAYRAYADIGSLVLVDPGQAAGVNFVTTECVKVGTPLTLGMLFDEAEPYTNVPFSILRNWENDPPNRPKSRSLLSQRFYVSDDEDIDAICRNIQLRVDWGTDTVQNELLTYSVFGSYYAEN
jgi:hypothetical protein